jgi:hypothetical protein
MQNIRRLIRLGFTLSAGVLTAILSMLTTSAGRGQCPQCGYQADLHACKHCGWTACLGCWQKHGKYGCPDCGRANP